MCIQITHLLQIMFIIKGESSLPFFLVFLWFFKVLINNYKNFHFSSPFCRYFLRLSVDPALIKLKGRKTISKKSKIARINNCRNW